MSGHGSGGAGPEWDGARPPASLSPGAADPSESSGPCPETDALAAPVAGSPPPPFPGGGRGTGLVLYAVAAGLRLAWRLGSADLGRGLAGFSAGGGRPWAVLRLRRAGPEGGAEPMGEAVLGSEVAAGLGECDFAVPPDHGRYHAELGLTDPTGGWLMLARSNGLDNCCAVGLDLARLPRPPSTLAIVSAEPALAAAVRAEPADPTDPVQGGGQPAVAAVFPLPARRVPPPWALPARTPGASARWHGPPPLPGVPALTAPRLIPAMDLDAVAALVPGRFPEVPDQDGRVGRVAAALLRDLETRPLRLPPPGSAAPALPDPAAAAGPPAAESPPDTAAPVLTPVLTEVLWSLTYGQAPVHAEGLLIEAELRITGQAAPGSRVDLFGFPYRVGPGGRFQLRLAVKDPALIARALALNPPPELGLTRED